jgi:hypothetical protein
MELVSLLETEMSLCGIHYDREKNFVYIKHMPSSTWRGLCWLIDLHAGTGAVKAGKRKGGGYGRCCLQFIDFCFEALN